MTAGDWVGAVVTVGAAVLVVVAVAVVSTPDHMRRERQAKRAARKAKTGRAAAVPAVVITKRVPLPHACFLPPWRGLGRGSECRCTGCGQEWHLVDGSGWVRKKEPQT